MLRAKATRGEYVRQLLHWQRPLTSLQPLPESHPEESAVGDAVGDAVGYVGLPNEADDNEIHDAYGDDNYDWEQHRWNDDDQ
ncbi:hypothetical protein PsorP6_006059 [Peronosclerospora sorghi]|uniref:Uncharacterized protein n=1 Tax=Peronosclerospora sorghi TaxID=230839 RepID=A0ACC0W3N8_9STRA|nr:hypothetical protein PsorP6_006059 [Peronosclerospora sorghi]